MPVSLLSLSSLMDPLRGFVAVGRRMSITRAAEDLCLTQSAISRQVHALESRLGVKLLVRGHRSITLTAEGERLFRTADAALQQLQEAVGAIGDEARRRIVTLSASIGVTGLWLLPRLGRFQSAHPGIELRIAAQNRLTDLAREDVDLAIRYCSRSAAPEGALHLFDEAIAPVAHPSLRMGENLVDDQVLLEFDDPARPWLHWDTWLKTHAMAHGRPRSILRFNQYDQVAYSAMAGQGIALGRVPLLGTMLAEGQLVTLAPAEAPHGSDHGYWLLSEDTGDDARTVVDWLVAQARPSA